MAVKYDLEINTDGVLTFDKAKSYELARTDLDVCVVDWVAAGATVRRVQIIVDFPDGTVNFVSAEAKGE